MTDGNRRPRAKGATTQLVEKFGDEGPERAGQDADDEARRSVEGPRQAGTVAGSDSVVSPEVTRLVADSIAELLDIGTRVNSVRWNQDRLSTTLVVLSGRGDDAFLEGFAESGLDILNDLLESMGIEPGNTQGGHDAFRQASEAAIERFPELGDRDPSAAEELVRLITILDGFQGMLGQLAVRAGLLSADNLEAAS